MIVSILTLFPEVFQNIFSSSIINRAQKKGLLTIRYINIRDFASDKHKSVDDRPYGGGAGMLMRVDVVEKAIAFSKIKNQKSKLKTKEKIILLDPKGKLFSQNRARQFSRLDHLILVCGHYEGIDERIHHFADESVSIGNYILTGGEIPAMVIVDSTVRLIQGVLGKAESTVQESFVISNKLEYPQYTRPPIYKNYAVPPVLLSGNHKEIYLWKKKHSIKIFHKK